MPTTPGSVGIHTPAAGAEVMIGTAVRVTGGATPREFTKPNGTFDSTIPPEMVRVGFEGAPLQPARALDVDWSSWDATLQSPGPGARTIVAVASWVNQTANDRVTIEVVAIPLDLAGPTAPVGTVQFPITATGRQVAAIVADSVRARVDGRDWVLAPAGTLRWSGTVQLDSDRVPPGGRDVPVLLSASSTSGAVYERAASVKAVDVGTPVVTGFTPADGAKLPGTAVGARPVAEISVRDPGDGQLNSGVTAVDVRVDEQVYAAQRTADPQLWTCPIFVPGADEHTITVEARDALDHRSVPVRHQVVVIRRTDLRDLSRQTYLQELLNFATERIITRKPVAAETVPFVTTGLLRELLGQDVAAVAQAGAAQAAMPVRTLRLVIETLAGYLRPGPAPVAAWPLHDGPGATVTDTASGRAQGTIVGAQWLAEDPPLLHFDPAAQARVQVDQDAAAQARVRDQLTVIARIRPSTDTGKFSVVIGKEGEYLLSRGPAGTLQWALATTTPGWAWTDTGVTVPIGQWTHVMAAYDGAQMRVWTDGVLRSTIPASGPIGDVAPASNELWIGSRPDWPDFFAGEIEDVAVFDRALTEADLYRLLGRSPDAAGTRPWVDDDVPPGAVLFTNSDAWTWTDGAADGPDPSSGARYHISQVDAGMHQHYFIADPAGFPVDRGDVLVTDVWLDPQQPPRSVMVQWRDSTGSWEHRAFWGEDLIDWGTDGTDSRRRIGDLPPAGSWTTLRVPARLVGLENQVVHGVAYTLLGGRVAWDRTGRSTAWAAAAASGYLNAAYAALLRAHGTSEVELRLARGAAALQRAALAQRLGIRPTPAAGADPAATSDPLGELDQLLLDPAELTADALAQLFGYADPLGAAAAPDVPKLTAWRLATLRSLWRTADRVGGQPPVIDPEVLVPDDIGDPAGGAAALLRERRAWRDTQLGSLDAIRAAAADDNAAVAAALGTVLIGVDLDALVAARRAGQDISVALTAAGLHQPELLRLVQLRNLARTGPLRDDEWDDGVRALVRVLRRRNWANWRDQETTADIVVDPAVFRDSAAALPEYMDAAARQEWGDRLAARVLTLEAVLAGQRAAIDDADDAALPRVRDALLGRLDPQIPGLSVADALSSTLFVDAGAGAEDVTSRVGQAIEAVQGVIFAARTNRLGPQGPWPPAGPARDWVLHLTDRYPIAEFDEEWQWLGTYAAWQAAASVFFRPELLLYPTLRSVDELASPPGYTPTAPFKTFVAAVATAGSDLSPDRARELAGAYNQALPAATKNSLAAVTVRGYRLDTLVLTDQLTRDQLAACAECQKNLLPGGELSAIPRELQETLWLVPLHLAVTFNRLGQYQAAIDWVRTLYAYDQSPADRLVFGGFRREASRPQPLTRPTRWLTRDTLNPHLIADGRAGAQLRFTLLLLARCLVEQADAEFTFDTQESRPRARTLYLVADRSLHVAEFDDAIGADVPRIPANPLLAALRGRCTANLGKLRRGLTIAGVPRPAAAGYENADEQLVLPSLDGGPLAPPGRPPQPTPYRYATLVTRAQQLLALSGQVESAYLEALAGADREGYTELQARNNLALTQARSGVLQAAVDVAGAEVQVSQIQVLKARRQAQTLEGWVAGGASQWEQQLLDSYQVIAGLRTIVAFTEVAVATTQAAAAASGPNPAAPAVTAVAMGAAAGRYLATGALVSAEAAGQQAETRASFERRAQEWQLQAALARDDATIAAQQGAVLQRRRTLAELEQQVGNLEQQHTAATVQYLAGRRLTGELYAWVAGQLGEVYRYLLRQATSVAQMAQQQLAFERQLPPPDVIKADYWTAAGPAGPGPAADRRGLTGSARLLRDLTELDEHAFETNRRKLNLEHTFSLSATAPEAFAEFRRTGVLPFATPLETFDRRFPGHFLRTIRRVRVSLVALIPPAQGIAAQLTCSGQSRTVVGQYGVFRPITLTRPPERVAYTAPVNATGVFELDPQPDLKYFFEDHGVDTTWELRLPRPANSIDYRAIADVRVTLEYTALNDDDYARQVRAALPRRLRGTLGLSIRDTFPEAWYTLVEPDPGDPGRVPPVTLPVTLVDFPANLDSIRLEAVTLLVVRAAGRDDDTPELAVDHLHLVRGDRRVAGGASTAVRDVISTRLGATTWLPLTDPPALVAAAGADPARWDPTPTGDWELAMSSDPDTREALRSGAVADLTLVFSYRGDLPPWPET